MSEEIVISASGLCKSFRAKEVLNGVTLGVKKGSVYGFLGKNGSGKTTTIKCLLGLLHATGGSAAVLGCDSGQLSEAAKARIGYIPQENDLMGWMTVSQIIRYTKIFYAQWNDDTCTGLLERFEIPEKEIVGNLSTGQAQRLAIVLALSFNPEVLILDEPVGALDPEGRRDFLATILDIVRNGERTILLSSHITSDIERIADTIGILKDGRIQIEKPMEDLKDSVKKLHIIPRNGRAVETATIPGLLSLRKEDAFVAVTVQDYSEEMKKSLETAFRADVEVCDLNLEDIFLSYHSG